MERYSSRTIDELGRLVLHSDVRQLLDLKTNDNVSMLFVENIAIVRRKSEGVEQGLATSAVDELGRIEIPAEYRKILGWQEKDRLAVYLTDNIIILKKA